MVRPARGLSWFDRDPAIGAPSVDGDHGKVGAFSFSREDVEAAMRRFAVASPAPLLRLAQTLDDGDRRLEMSELIAAGRLATADLTKGFSVGPAALAEVMKAQRRPEESLLLRMARRFDDGDRVLEPHELERAAKLLGSVVEPNDVAAIYERTRALPAKVETIGVVSDATRSREILAARFPTTNGSEPELRVVITGGVHGDEPAGAGAALAFAEWLATNPVIRERVEFVVIPMVNPRGLEDGTRRTPEDVDTNRSLGPDAEHKTQEGKIVTAFLENNAFDLGIDLHSGSPKRNGFWLMHRGAEDLLGPVMKAFDVEWPVLAGDVRPYIAQRPGVLVSRNAGTMKDEFVRCGARWGVTVEAPRSISYLDRVFGEMELIQRIVGAALGRQAIA